MKRDISGGVSGPKVGKIDPTGNPHVGGNTWAGGTGGRDTAGLGGRGGPYRLDAGHTVHQVSENLQKKFYIYQKYRTTMSLEEPHLAILF